MTAWFWWHTFNAESFCSMHPMKKLCESAFGQDLSCSQKYNINSTTELGHFYAEYFGFFKSNRNQGTFINIVNLTNEIN